VAFKYWNKGDTRPSGDIARYFSFRSLISQGSPRGGFWLLLHINVLAGFRNRAGVLLDGRMRISRISGERG